MELPLEITFRNLESSEAMDTLIRGEAEGLDRLYSEIMRCRVTVEEPHKHQNKGKLYRVKIALTVPGKELVVNKGSDEHHEHEDVYVAISDAFNAIGKQLKEHTSRLRSDVKTHEVPPHGKISELNAEKGYGMIESSDGREIYFHKNSLLNAKFDELEVATEVRFAEEEGDKGPQASTVKVIGKHHLVD